MPDDDLQSRVQAIKEITELFKLERYAYASVIIACLLVFLVSVGMGLARQLGASSIAVMLFSSGGGAVYSIGRLLHMWNRAMSMLDGKPENGAL